MAKITGYKLQHALRELTHARDIFSGQFEDSLKAFPGDEKPLPEVVMGQLEEAEGKIARLQTAQGEYNLRVKVDVGKTRMTLSEAVKRVGGAGRIEKLWRNVAAPKKDRYGMDSDTRDPDAVVAKKTVSTTVAAQKAKAAARWASSLREAIQVGNATEIEIELDESLFD